MNERKTGRRVGWWLWSRTDQATTSRQSSQILTMTIAVSHYVQSREVNELNERRRGERKRLIQAGLRLWRELGGYATERAERVVVQYFIYLNFFFLLHYTFIHMYDHKATSTVVSEPSEVMSGSRQVDDVGRTRIRERERILRILQASLSPVLSCVSLMKRAEIVKLKLKTFAPIRIR